MIVTLLLCNHSACPQVGSDWVWAQPPSDPTKSSGQTFNPSLTERMIGLDGLEYQRVAVGLVGVKIWKIEKIQRENDENRPKSFEISPDPSRQN